MIIKLSRLKREDVDRQVERNRKAVARVGGFHFTLRPIMETVCRFQEVQPTVKESEES